MPDFKYIALNLSGEKINGVEACESRKLLSEQLEAKSLLLLSCKKISGKAAEKEKAEKAPPKSLKKIPLDDLVLFTRQLATMFRVGVPLLRILYILKEQIDNPRLQSVVSCVAKDVEAGSTLTDAFKNHPKVFPPIYCNMLAAGETSGNISVVLEKLCQSMEYEAQIKAQIKGALQYPIIVSIALAVAFAVLMGFVIPSFLPLFEQLGGDIPPLTKVCIAISALFTDYWYFMAGAIIAAVLTLKAVKRTDQGELAIARFLLKIPLVGTLMAYSFMARFGSLFAILQSSGILIVDALYIVNDCIRNKALQSELKQAAVEVESGRSIAASLSKSLYFPKIMLSMIAIGEASGNLEEMMTEASRHFETEVNHAVKKLTGAIGPILIVFMAVAVGFFAMAIYLPIWKMTEIQMEQ